MLQWEAWDYFNNYATVQCPLIARHFLQVVLEHVAKSRRLRVHSAIQRQRWTVFQRTRSSCLPYRGRERIIMEHLSFLGSRNKGESKREIVLSLYTSYNLSKTHRMKTSSTNEQVYPRLCEISGSYGSVPNCLKETFLSPTMGCCHTPFFLWTRAPENDLLLWFSDLVSRSAASPSPGN